MSRQLNVFGKPVVKKAALYRSQSNRYEKFVNAYVACNPGLPLVEANRKADDRMHGERRGMEKNEEEVEMMLSAEASLEEKDERLARSSFVVDKRGLQEGRHRLLSENVR